MVGDLQDLRRQPVAADRREQVRLRLPLDVAREQHPPSVPRHPQHHGGVVRLRLSPTVGTPRRRPEHLDDEVTEPGHLTADGGAQRPAGLDDRPRRLLEAAVAAGQGAAPQRGDVRHRDDVGQPTDVVGVRVARDEQVEPPPPGRPQPPGGRVVDAGVHQQADAGGLHEHRVPLPDVDRGHREGADGPGPQARERRHDQGDHRRAGGDLHRGRAATGTPTGAPAATASRSDGERTHQRHRAHDRRRPGERDHGPDPGEPASGRGDHGQTGPGRRQHEPARRRPRERHDGPHPGDERGERRGRDRHEVGRDARHADLLPRAEQHREDRHLGAERDREREPQRAGDAPAAEALGDRRRDHQHPEGGRRREQQPEPTTERGVDAGEDQHRPGQGVPAVGPTPADLGREGEPGHRGGTEHRGLRPGQHDEPEHEPDEQAPTPARSEPQRAGEGDPSRDDDGHVRAADGGQVTEAGVAHRVAELVGQA